MAGGGGGLLLLLMMVMVCAALSTDTPHQGEAANHVEDVYIEDTLGNWLDNFDTYTFMVKQDLDDTHLDPEAREDGTDDGRHDEEEQEEGESVGGDGESWNAPIAVTLNKHGLLNPHVDYHVMVESLVAEAGSIFLTLRKYENKSQCGVGGLTHKDPATASISHNHSGQRLAIGEEHNETIINFDVQDDVNSSNSESLSEWDGLSEEFWWASGKLAGGGVLSLSFTPPECGCLTLSTYYALPVGNLTLVVGPQAYPSELQMLLCVDHLAAYEDSADYYDDRDRADGEDNDYINGGQEEGQAVAERQESSTESNTGEGGGTHIVNGRSTRLETQRARKEAKRLAKIKRQKKRQKIRQAGRRQARKQARNSRRNIRQRNRRQRNNGQQAKTAWKKIKRQNRRRQRINRRRNHHAVLEGESESSNITEGELRQNTRNATHLQAEKLITLLLGKTSVENETEEENTTSAVRGDKNKEEIGEESEGTEVVSEPSTRREWRRRNRQQRRKLKRRERKNSAHPPGVKFCCKQGVKQKKFVFAINSTSEDQLDPDVCSSSSNSIVTTFASSQFNITQERCSEVFHTCCNNFTSDIWEEIKVKKAERRLKRKQRRKSRRQQRKQVRKERKRNRMVQRRQGRNHGKEEEGEEVHVEE